MRLDALVRTALTSDQALFAVMVLEDGLKIEPMR